MKPESSVWQRLYDRAEARLRPRFADRVLGRVHGTPAERAAWRRLDDRADAHLRPGFAARVILAAREVAGPSASSQFMLGAATAVACLLAVVFVQQNRTASENARSLAAWQELANDAQALDADL